MSFPDSFIPFKLYRSTNKLNSDEIKCTNCPPKIVRPLVWSNPEKPEYMLMFDKIPLYPEPLVSSVPYVQTISSIDKSPEELTAPLIHSDIKPNSTYPVHTYIVLHDLAQELQYAFNKLGLIWSRQGNKFRWDVRFVEKEKCETSLDVQILSNKEELLYVYFNLHYGNDRWFAHDLIDRISELLPVDMSESINPWKKEVTFN